MSKSILVCCRATAGRVHPPIHGALQKTCADCAEAVWASPMSIEAIATATSGNFEIVCVGCGMKRMAVDDAPQVMPPSTGQLHEARRELERRREYFNP